MAPDKEAIEERLARFEEVCRAEGIKLTHQRLEIFREVARAIDHPDAEKVHRGVRRRLPTISLDTVYRTLWMLEGMGLLTTLGPPRKRLRFDANLDRHHHFVCTRCGLTRDFYSGELDRLRLPRDVAALGRVERTQVEVRGICRQCAAKEKGKKEGKEGKR